MQNRTYRITDATSGRVIANVTDETAMSAYLRANNLYEVGRDALPGVTIVRVNAANTNKPGS